MNSQRPIAPAPNFPELKKPTSDYGALMDGRLSPPLVLEIDLSTARSFALQTAQAFNVSGNSFYVDQAPDVGTAYVQFEGVPDATNPLIRPAFYVQQGFTARAPFHTLRVANTAQPGKLMRFMFGTDIDFIPSLNGQVAITGSVNATPYGMPYQASYKSQTNMGANTPDTIFTPGSNANGAVVWSASSYSSGAGSIPSSMIAKSSAPAGILDGDVIATTDFIGPTGASFISSYRLLNPVFVAAGKGLYHIPQQAETGSQRCVLYTLL